MHFENKNIEREYKTNFKNRLSESRTWSIGDIAKLFLLTNSSIVLVRKVYNLLTRKQSNSKNKDFGVINQVNSTTVQNFYG